MIFFSLATIGLLVLILVQIFLWRYLRFSELSELRSLLGFCAISNIFLIVIKFITTNRIYGIVWCCFVYTTFIYIAYLAGKFAAKLMRSQSKMIVLLPTSTCMIFCVQSWPPTRMQFFITVVSCMIVCIAVIIIGILHKASNRLLYFAKAFVFFLTAITIAAITNGFLWDTFWLIGTIPLIHCMFKFGYD